MEKIFIVQLAQDQQGPVKELETVLSIGRSQGDMTIDHPDVSTPHCTLINNGGIVGVIDQGSEKGTYINEQKIPAKKLILLMQDDQLSVGSVSLVISEKKEQQSEEPIPEMEEELKLEGPSLEQKPSEPKEEKTQILTQADLKAEEAKEKKAATSVEEVKSPMGHKSDVYEELELTAVKKISPEVQRAGALIRFFAFSSDVLISYWLLMLFKQQGFLSALEPLVMVFELMAQSVMPLLSLDYETYQIHLNIAFLLFSTYLFLRIFSSLLFGVSVGQLLAGMKASGSFVRVRSSALTRSFLEIFTKLTVVTELPALVGMKTLKEKITQSELTVYSRSLSLIVAPVSFLILTYFILFSSLLEMTTVPVDIEPIAKSFPAQEHSGEGRKVKSNYFAFQKTLESAREFVSYPSFELEQGEKKIYRPVINFFHLASQGQASFARKKSFDAKKILSVLTDGYLLAPLFFPEITSFVEGMPVEQSAFQQELQELIQTSLLLNPDEAISHFFRYGPFYQAFLDFQQAFALLSSYETGVKLDFMESGSSFFVRLKKGVMGKVSHQLFLWDRDRSEVFELLVSAGQGQLEDAFYNDFLQGVLWGDIKANDEDLQRLENIDLYTLMDFFDDKTLDEDLRKKLDLSLFRYYGRIVKVAEQVENANLKEEVIKKISKLEQFLKDFYSQEKFDKIWKNYAPLLALLKKKETNE